MIISENQARLAAHHAAAGHATSTVTVHDISSELLRAATDAANAAPEVRSDRIEAARRYLDAGPVDSRELAAKIISRIVSDSLR